MLYNIQIYETRNAKLPFDTWLKDLDEPIRARINKRLHRLILGNFGDCEFVSDGISELRLDFWTWVQNILC
jgi:putative addiction module killer protein